MMWFIAIVIILFNILLIWNLYKAIALFRLVTVQNNFLRSLLFQQQEPTMPSDNGYAMEHDSSNESGV